jgi:hypothetical protein
LLLASGDLAPRKRARDQQADLAGLALKRRVLDALAARDPEPDDMEGALLAIVVEVGSPPGATRAIALALFEDWRIATETPGWVAHLLDEALRSDDTSGG